MDQKTYAVITGDVIGSTRLSKDFEGTWLESLSRTLDYVGKDYSVPFSIFRGDSFQGATSKPDEALKDALILRLQMISTFEPEREHSRLDARIAIGIGKIDPHKDNSNVGEMTGEAFINSGLRLDEIHKSKRTLIIKTPWPEVDEELNIYCVVLDRLIGRWTKKRAVAVMYRLQGLILEEIGTRLGIGASAVARRLEKTDYDIVKLILKRYSDVITNKLNSND